MTTVSPLQDFVTAAIARQSAPLTPRVTAPEATGNADNVSATDSTSVSATSTQASQTANLQASSVGFAQLGSLIEVAQTGTQQIGTILQRLQTLAEQATNSDGSDATLSDLNSEFQQLLSQVDAVAGSINYGGQNLANGSLNSNDALNAALGGSGQTPPASFSLADITTQGLFGKPAPDIATAPSAANALVAVNNAQGVVNGASDTLNNVQSQVSFALATVESALSNSDASSSVLSESDLAGGSALSSFLDDANLTAQAQTGNLPDSILNLIQG